MPSVQRWLVTSVALFLLLDVSIVRASAVSDFQARLTQTLWNIQQTEIIVRSLPLSTASMPTPEGLASYLGLLSENVEALTRAGAGAATDEQRRVMAEGLKSVATALRDLAALAANRGLTTAASTLAALETSCRAAMTRL